MSRWRTGDAEELGALLRHARARTAALTSDLGGEERRLGPRLSIVNPPLWELGHVAWFQEYWCLRYRGSASPAPSLLPDADAWYNSATVPHDARWDLPLPSFPATLEYLERVLERVLSRLEAQADDPGTRYFTRLAAYHECMHAEAFAYTRQTLAYPAPVCLEPAVECGGPWRGDAQISGGRFMLGAQPGGEFVFDNEKWAHDVSVAPFRMARAPVTCREFLQFVEDGGYRARALWSSQGWAWREQAQARTPVYWRCDDGAWRERVHDRHVPLRLDRPVMHVNWYEADAYCRWAGRRLPTEAEWEFAASTAPAEPGRKRRYPWGDDPPRGAHAHFDGSGCERPDVAAHAAGDSAWGVRQLIGNVWEWTADWFQPYPGFSPDPYKEYSAPWFGSHKVLRGGCHATSGALISTVYRNFYTPDRQDVYAGFRTCAA